MNIVAGGSILTDEIISWMSALIRVEETREQIYNGISRKICDVLYANGCRNIEEFKKGVKPFIDAYIFTTSAGCTDFDFDRVKARYANHYELYKAFKTSIGDQRKYFSSGTRSIFFIVYIIYCLILDSRGLTECNKKYQAIDSKRTRFSQRLRMFFTRNYIATGN